MEETSPALDSLLLSTCSGNQSRVPHALHFSSLMYKMTTLNQLVLDAPPASRNWAGTGTLGDACCQGPLERRAPSIPSYPPLGSHPLLSLPVWLTLQTQLMSLLPFPPPGSL